MAFNNSITARYDELRSPNPPSSSATTGTTTPSRYSGSFMQSHSQSFGDTRASVQRRQTTDLSKMPAITPIGQQPTPTTQGESVDIAATVRQTTLAFPSISLQTFTWCCHPPSRNLPLSDILWVAIMLFNLNSLTFTSQQTFHKAQLVRSPLSLHI